jgi:CheY-like chemotaxis protein
MEAIGLLAGGVAHDLNNILSGIVGYPELLLMQIEADSPLHSPIKAIQESGERAAAVVSDLLTVARGVASAKTTADLNELVTEYLQSPEHRRLGSLYPQVKCETRLHPRLGPVTCSLIHVRKCIMNLVTNAMEAIDGAGVVRIATCHRPVDEKMARENGIQAGRYVVLTVADDGKGIAPRDLEHIFEPFYTKKAMGFSGTGLGLAVVWNSMADHDGTVLVESGAQGSAFHLYFPVSDKDAAVEGERVRFDDLRGRGETILVVDDEPHLLEVTAGMLTALGYETACLGSGEAAVDYLRENRADLVVLDMLMDPGINGRQTYERIIRFHPDQKAIIASGFSESEEVVEARRLGVSGFIKKPYTMEKLGAAVKEALRAPP